MTPPDSPSPPRGNEARRFPCPGCGAVQEFTPENGRLTCPYCGRTEAIPATADEVRERSYEEYLRVRPHRVEEPSGGSSDLRCESCGATLALGPGESAGACPFCASPVVMVPHDASPWIAPESLLPFRNTREEASGAVRGWLASRWFAPSTLRRVGRPDAVRGVYLPYWTFDAHTTSHYLGQRGEHYTTTEFHAVRDRRGRKETRRRTVRKTRWFPVSGTVSRWFDDVLVPAARSLLPRRLAALEPWDLSSLLPYDPAYLAGFEALRYETDLAAAFEQARRVMDTAIRNDVARDIGGDVQRILDVRTSFSGITYKHLLLPVWVASYRLRGKAYQVLVNARSGEVQGDRPYSLWKIAGLVAAVAVLLGAALLIARIG